MSALPAKWILAQVRHLSERRGGGTPSRSNPSFFNGELPWFTVADLPPIGSTPPKVSRSREGITREAVASSAAKEIPAGSVLFATRVSVGKTAIAERPVATNQDFRSVLPGDAHSSEYLAWFLSHTAVFNLPKDRGTTIKGITTDAFDSIQVPIPPLPEQHRIVAKIEALMARSRKAREALKQVAPLLERYRRSILAEAVAGHLTAGWRDLNPGVESAQTVLERIDAERRKQGFASAYRVIESESDFPNVELPDGWSWCRVGQIADVRLGGTPARSESRYWGGDIPWVSSGEVNNCRIMHTREHITQRGIQESNARIYPQGTVLIAMIGEGKTRGQAAMLDIEAATNQNVAGLVFDVGEIEPTYIWFWALSEYEKTRGIGRGGNQPALNGAKVRALPVPLPPIEEQREIVTQVSALLSSAAQLLVQSTATFEQMESLDQSILAKAFRGELLPQDPSDEPAEALLARIRTERESAGPILRKPRVAHLSVPSASKRARKRGRA